MTEGQKNGTISELLAAQWFVRNGYVVSRPINDFCPYDLIADNGTDGPKRVQVKTIYFTASKSRYVANCDISQRIASDECRYRRKRYDKNDFDLWAFVCEEHNAIYIIPHKFMVNRVRITFYPDGNTPKRRQPFDPEQYRQALKE